MKRYKLKKDAPAFKAGTECYIEETGNMVPCRGISYTIVHKDQLEKNPNILAEWFEEIKPAEPLIKDEKIRKAVRAWAEANNFLDEIEVHSITVGTRFSIGYYDIEFLGYFIYDLEANKAYTISELCGEEEE